MKHLRFFRLPSLAILVSLGACAHRTASAPPDTLFPLDDAPAAAPLATDDDYGRARADFDLLRPGSPRRQRARVPLEKWLLDEARRARAADRPDDAWESLRGAMALYDPLELRGPVADEPLAAALEEYEPQLRRRGAHREVITVLGARTVLRPDDTGARDRLAQVTEWLSGASGEGDVVDGCQGRGCERLIDDYEAAVTAFPAKPMIERLAALYWQRARGAGTAGSLTRERPQSFAEMLRASRQRSVALELVRLYLWTGQPAEALAAVRRLQGEGGDDPEIREAVEHALSPSARASDWLALAELTGRGQGGRPTVLRVCREGAERFATSVELHLCWGRAAEEQDQPLVAIGAFQRALALAPDQLPLWHAVAAARQAHLARLAGEERPDRAEAELRRVEQLHDDARKRFPDDPLRRDFAAALFEAGRAAYNAGHVDDARRFLERSMEVTPTEFAVEQLGIIALKSDHAEEAAGLFWRGVERVSAGARPGRGHSEGNDRARDFWLGRLLRDLGDALEILGRTQEAVDARRRGVEAWDRLLAQRLDPDEKAEFELERGKLLYLLGERERGIAAIERAIDSQPERTATYSDALVFLAPRGEAEEALDAYHRALGRSTVSEYIKVYASLWILDMQRRLGQPEDELAVHFLGGVKGSRWHHQLARWASGQETEAELGTHADTPGRRCEYDFYRAMRAAGSARSADTRGLLRKVLATRMMGFFEFEMASYFLRHESELAAPHGGGTSAPR